MADEFYSLVTDIGAIKQLESVRDGVPFDVYEIALGDSNGSYYTPQTDQTALRNEVWRGLIEKCEWVDNKFYCVTTVPASVGGFTVREAGVFDSDNNLIVITKFPETTKQDPESGTVKQLTIRIELELSNKELAELVINPNIQLVTKDELTETLTDIDNTYQKVEEKGQPLGYAPLDENNKIPLPFIPKLDTKSILTPFCLNSCRLDAKGNPDLLSCETVKVEKYTASGLGVFYTALGYKFEKDGIVYSDTELTIPKGTIVAVNSSTNYIAFGDIETLSEDETNPHHYSATNIGDFYIQNTLAVGVQCFSDPEFTNSIGVVTYLNLTKICISQDETYTYNGHTTTHIYITAHAPFTYTTAQSKTHEVEEDLILDVVDLCPEAGQTKNFNLFVVNEDDGYSLVALSNTIFTQMLEPDNQQINDIWFKVLEPLASYIYLLNIWQETNLVPVGVFSLEGGEN